MFDLRIVIKIDCEDILQIPEQALINALAPLFPDSAKISINTARVKGSEDQPDSAWDCEIVDKAEA